MAELFISHSSHDQEVTAWLVDQLRRAGFNSLFVDFDPADGIPAGRDWERELYAQLRRADAVIFLVTPASAASKWCFAEVSLARSIGKPVLPALVNGTERPSMLLDVQWVMLTPGEADSVDPLLRGLQRAGLDPLQSFPWDAHRSPFPGLASFASEDAAVFFGRDKEITELRDRMRATLQRRRGQFLAVVGPSGSGKSSLVRAGLLPRLANQPDQWTLIPPFFPGSDPVPQLARSLSHAFALRQEPVESAALERRLGRGSDELVQIVRLLCPESNGTTSQGVVVFLDQAEELVTRTGHDKGAYFLRFLHGALHSESPLWVVATLRTEFLDRLLVQAGGADIFDDTFVVGPLARERLPEVIQGPAHRAGVDFDAAVVQRMVDDTGGGDSLPLLAFTLLQLYERAGVERQITMADYEGVGGVVGALRRQADTVLRRLEKRFDRAQVFTTLLQLVSVEARGELVRRRVRMSTLSGDQVQIVQTFVDARLLQTRDVEGDTVVEVAHEALLRLWEPLQAAVESSRRKLEARSEIERTARAWDDGGRDDSFLPRGARLAVAFEEWAVGSDELGHLESTFLAESRAFAQRELKEARRVNLRLRRLVLGLGVLMVAVLSASFFAVDQGREAQLQQRIAIAGLLTVQASAARETDPLTAIRLGLTAVGLHDDAESRANLVSSLASTRLRRNLTGVGGGVTDVAFAPNGEAMASAGFDGTVNRWGLFAGRSSSYPDPLRQFQSDGGRAYSVVFSPDSRTLAIANANATIELRDVSNPDQPSRLGTPLTGHEDMVLSVAFSPDGRTLASGSADRTVRLWDVSNPADAHPLGAPLTGHDLSVGSVTFAPDGRTLASGGLDGRIILWDVTDLQHPDIVGQPLSGQADSVSSIAFAPDGQTLASGNSDETVTLWDMRDRTHPTLLGQPLRGHSHRVSSVAFSPDGRILASASFDRTAILWDISDRNSPGRLGTPLVGHASLVNSVAFAPDGLTLATGGNDETVTLWNVQDLVPAEQLGPSPDGQSSVLSLAYSRGGELTLATSGYHAQLTLWDLSSPGRPTAFAAPMTDTHNATMMAFAPDGQTLATAGNDEAVSLWDISEREHPRRLGAQLTGDFTQVRSLAFAPEGRPTLAVAGNDGTVLLWDVSNPARPDLLGAPLTKDMTEISALAFSRDGNTLAVASSFVSGYVVLWDVTDREHPARIGDPLRTGVERVFAVAFSWDGKTLASGNDAGTLTLWNISDPAHATRWGAPLAGRAGTVNSIAFSPGDRDALAMASDNGTVTLWNVENPTRPIPLGVPLDGPFGSVTSVGFDPDGFTLATTNLAANNRSFGGVLLWDLEDLYSLHAVPLGRACDIARRGLNPEEWGRYVPDLPFQETCILGHLEIG